MLVHANDFGKPKCGLKGKRVTVFKDNVTCRKCKRLMEMRR